MENNKNGCTELLRMLQIADVPVSLRVRTSLLRGIFALVP